MYKAIMHRRMSRLTNRCDWYLVVETGLPMLHNILHSEKEIYFLKSIFSPEAVDEFGLNIKLSMCLRWQLFNAWLFWHYYTQTNTCNDFKILKVFYCCPSKIVQSFIKCNYEFWKWLYSKKCSPFIRKEVMHLHKSI